MNCEAKKVAHWCLWSGATLIVETFDCSRKQKQTLQSNSSQILYHRQTNLFQTSNAHGRASQNFDLAWKQNSKVVHANSFVPTKSLPLNKNTNLVNKHLEFGWCFFDKTEHWDVKMLLDHEPECRWGSCFTVGIHVLISLNKFCFLVRLRIEQQWRRKRRGKYDYFRSY